MKKGSPKVLIVEQEDQWIRELQRIFEDDRFSFRVSVSTNSDDALTQVRDSDFDLVTVDIGLPGESVIAWKTIVTRLRALRPNARVLIVTGSPSLETAMEAINYYPITGYFSKKAFDMDVFERKLTDISQGKVSFRRDLDPLEQVAEMLRNLGACVARLNDWEATSEKGVQGVVFAILRAQYQDAQWEVTLGRTAVKEYRCDVLLGDLGVIVETKRIRDRAHVKKIEAELHDDIGGYRITRPGSGIVFLVWDSENYVAERSRFVKMFENNYKDVRVVFAP